MESYKLFPRKKNTLTKIAFGFFILFVAFQVAILSVNIRSTFQFALVSFIFIILLSYIFWRKAMGVLIIWVLISGAVRKWLVPQFSDIVYFFNFIILTGIYLRFFWNRIAKQDPLIQKHFINPFIAIFLFWGFCCALNPLIPNLIIGIVGLLLYFYYIPLAYVVPYCFETTEELIKYLRIFIYLSIPILFLGIVQFFNPVNAPINLYVPGDAKEIATTGINIVRITSTFSYISGYGTYLNVLILILVYLLSLKNISTKFTMFLYITLSLAIVNLFMTGSRGPFFITLISIIFYILLTGVMGTHQLKVFLPRLLLGVLIIFLLLSFTSFGKHAVSSFMSRNTTNEDIIPRLVDTYTTPLKFAKYVGVYGIGIGSTYQGVLALIGRKLAFTRMTREFEEEPERIVLETGVVGFVIAYLTRLVILIAFWNLFRSLNNNTLRLFALIPFFFQIQFLLGLNVLIFNHTSHLFFWFMVGFLFTLSKLDTKESKQFIHAKT